MALNVGQISPLPELSKIDYSALDFDTVKAAVVQYIKDTYPDEQNDFLESNTAVMIIDVLAYISDIQSQRADYNANENYLPTAKTKKSIIDILELVDYRLGRQSAASGEVKCTLVNAADQLLNISNELTVDLTISSADNILVLTTEDDSGDSMYFETYQSVEDRTSSIIIPSGTAIGEFIYAAMIEGQSQQDIFTADINSSSNQEYTLANPDVLDDSITSILVNGVQYTKVDNLAYENGATRSFEVKYDEENIATLRFGDNTFGAIPPAGAEILVDYRYGGGARGNLSKGAINETQTFELNGYTVTVKFENITSTTGGSDEESIEHAKKYAPKYSKTQVRTVTGEDYSIFASGYSDSTNGSISKAIATLRPYLAAYCGSSGPYTIDYTNEIVRLLVNGSQISIAFTEGTDITLDELIDDFNLKIESYLVSDDIPNFSMQKYVNDHYRFLGTVSETDNGFLFSGSNDQFKINYGGVIYQIAFAQITHTLDEVIDHINLSINTGTNTNLVQFRAFKYHDVLEDKYFLEIVSLKDIDLSSSPFKIESVANSAYGLLGFEVSGSPELYQIQCPVIALDEHKPTYTLEVINVVNNAYDLLQLEYSIGTNKNGKAYPCSANYIDFYVLAEGDNSSLVPASSTLKAALKNFLERFKQMTDELNIFDGQTKIVDMDININITKGYRSDLIVDGVNSFIDNFFNPDNNDFYTPLYISDIYRGLRQITGVHFVDITDIKENGTSQLTTGDMLIRNVEVDEFEIWTKGVINVTYAFTS